MLEKRTHLHWNEPLSEINGLVFTKEVPFQGGVVVDEFGTIYFQNINGGWGISRYRGAQWLVPPPDPDDYCPIREIDPDRLPNRSHVRLSFYHPGISGGTSGEESNFLTFKDIYRPLVSEEDCDL